MTITLDEMRAFVAVVDSGSISRAAASLGQTVSALSRALGRLESKLQTTLLRRTTRRLELSEEGADFLEQARAILAAVDEAEDRMAARRGEPRGRLRVDAASPFMLHVIVPLIAGYRARYPRIELELDSHDGIVDLLEQRTDVAIRIGALADSTLHARRIGDSRLRILASPAYLAAHGEPQHPDELEQHTLLGFSQPQVLNEWPLCHGDGVPLHIRPSLRAASGETLRQLALAGVGIVCLSDFMTRADRAAGRLCPLLTAHTRELRQPVNAVYYRNTALSARITSFVDYLIESLGPRGFED